MAAENFPFCTIDPNNAKAFYNKGYKVVTSIHQNLALWTALCIIHWFDPHCALISGRHRPKPVDAYNPTTLKSQLIETESELSKNVSPKSKPRSRNLKIVNNNNNARNSMPQNSIGSPQSNLTSKMEDSDSVITAIQKNANQDLSRTQVTMT